MTMRTDRHFTCPNGHKGLETTRENDQPFSASWESVTADGLIEHGKDERGYANYICKDCKAPMKVVFNP